LFLPYPFIYKSSIDVFLTKVLTSFAKFYTNHAMKTEIVINSGHVQLMVQFMQSRQIVLSQVFDAEQLALIIESTHQSGPHIPILAFATMLRQLASYLNEPDITLQIASMVTTGHLGIVGYVLHACSNLGEALFCLKRYGKLIVNAVDEMQVHQQQDMIELQWRHDPEIDCIVLELGIAIMMQFARQLVNQPLEVSAVHFVQKSPDHAERYAQYFACPVYFSQEKMSVVFPLRNLEIPISKPDKALLDILQQQADLALQALPKTDEFLHSVRLHLVRLCQTGQPHVDALADSLHLSSRTIQRRLAEHQVSFQQVLDEVRQQLCIQYLQQQIQLSDIAQLLGYSDQSAFTRAYKRWTGQTPHQQRIASRKNL
jgi:AraC-like DNA-binding protein